jgi:Flp pilus assembly pilin Flp
MFDLLPEVAYGRAVFDLLRARIGEAEDREAGVSTVEWVLISAILVTLVLAVGGILLTKWQNKATSIPTTTP